MGGYSTLSLDGLFHGKSKKEQMDDLGVPYLRHPDIYIYMRFNQHYIRLSFTNIRYSLNQVIRYLFQPSLVP